MRPLRARVAVLACLPLLAACGSTVQVSGQRTAGTGQGLSLPGDAVPGDTSAAEGPTSDAGRAPDAGGVAGGAGASGQGSGLPGGTTMRGSDGRPDTSQSSRGPASVPGKAPVAPGTPGVTASTITVGVVTSGDVGTFLSGAGISADYGDNRAQANAIANYINGHGGVAGRKLSLVFYDYSVSASQSTPAEAACTAFTEDHHVFVGTGAAGFPSNYHACMAKHHTLVLSDADLVADRSFLQQYAGNYFLVSDFSLDRRYRALVDGLYGQGYFGTSPKIGLLGSDDPAEKRAVKNGLIPALRAHGLAPTETVEVSSTDNSAAERQIASAALKFQADHITHVLFSYPYALYFMPQAESQRYRPRYGLDSRSAPGLLLEGSVPASQLHGALGVGWQPVQDVDASHDPGPVSSREALCAQIMKAAGQSYSGNRLNEGVALYYCDELFFLRDVLDSASEISLSGFRAAAERLRSSYLSPLTFRTTFGPERHDGASGYRGFAFQDPCSCFVYTTPVRTFP